MMKTKFKLAATAAAAALACAAAPAAAQVSDGVIKIGVMNDMSGLYADVAGPGSVRRRAHGGRGLRRRRARA